MKKQAEASRDIYKHMIEQISELDLKRKEQLKDEEELMRMKLAEAIKVCCSYLSTVL